jgi:hypothetical protein
MDQRRKPPKKGSVITFKFQELSNNGIPRFPVFLRIRSDLTWNDVLEAVKTKKPMSVQQKVVPSAKLSKQHSILFSVIPSRDAKTGKKIVTSDDEDEEAAAATTPTTTKASSSATTTKGASSTTTRKASSSAKKTDTREVCQYGEKCYRTNADHLKQYQHPSTKTKPKLTKTKSKTKSPCTFGAKCSRQSSVHLENYSHPSKSQSQDPIDISAEEEILDPQELIEHEEPASPTTTDTLLVKDKNKNRQFDDEDVDDDDDQQSSTRAKTNKRKRNLEEKPKLKSTRKRVKKT